MEVPEGDIDKEREDPDSGDRHEDCSADTIQNPYIRVWRESLPSEGRWTDRSEIHLRHRQTCDGLVG